MKPEFPPTGTDTSKAAMEAVTSIIADTSSVERKITLLLDELCAGSGSSFSAVLIYDPVIRKHRCLFVSTAGPQGTKKLTFDLVTESLEELAPRHLPMANEAYSQEGCSLDPGTRIFGFRLAFNGKIEGALHLAAAAGAPVPVIAPTMVLTLKIVSVLVENSILNSESQRKISKLTTLYEIARKSNSLLRHGNVLVSLLDVTESIIPSESKALYTADCSKETLTLTASMGTFDFPAAIPFGEGPEGVVANTKKPLLYPRDDFKSCLTLPMLSGESLVGIITLATTRSFAYSEDDVIALRIIAAQFTEMEALTTTLINIRSSTDTILESINAGLITVDMEGKLDYANAMARQMLPRLTEESIGKPFRDALGDNVLSEVIDTTIETMDFFNELKGSVYRDGEAAYLSMTTFPLKAGGGAPEGVTGIALFFKDVTEEERLRDELRTKERLSALGQLATGVAHEIRNPLSGIKMVMQLLQGEMAPDNPLLEHTRMVLDEVERLAKIISDLMDFARPKALTKTSGRLSNTVREAVYLLASLAESREVSISVEGLEDDWEPVLDFDHERMKQVFLNIIKNGIEAAPDNSRVVVKFSRTLGDFDGVCVAMTNFGDPIHPAAIGKIFNPFFTTKHNGTGLGLPITHSIVEEHRGKIRVDSSHGNGTTFTVMIPAQHHGAAKSSDTEKS